MGKKHTLLSVCATLTRRKPLWGPDSLCSKLPRQLVKPSQLLHVHSPMALRPAVNGKSPVPSATEPSLMDISHACCTHWKETGTGGPGNRSSTICTDVAVRTYCQGVSTMAFTLNAI